MKPLPKLFNAVRNIYQTSSNFILDLFFPRLCVGCGVYGYYVCAECIKKIEPIMTSTCPDCGKIIEMGRFCARCKSRLKIDLAGIIVALNINEGPTREMIHHLKYSGYLEIGKMLGSLMVRRLLREKLPKNTVLVPVPLYADRKRERGFNQSELLADYVSKSCNISCVNALVRNRKTESQVTLSGVDRRQNLLGAFECVDTVSISKKTILLVDDVTTTYSTLNECASVLKKAGAYRVFGLVVAKG